LWNVARIKGCQFGFLEARFLNSGFFQRLWLFLEIKKARENLAFSGFFSGGKAWLWKNIVRAAYSLQISSEKSL